MSQTAEQILQKIAFLEKDMELHKKILTSLPKDKEDEMEDVIKIIIELKEKIETLKASIAEVDPAVFEQINKMERASAEFKKIAAEREFTEVVTLDQSGECVLELKEGQKLECLVKARDNNGDWVVLTIDGETAVYPANTVV